MADHAGDVRRALVLVGPELAADHDLLTQVAEAEFRALQLDGAVRVVTGTAELRTAVESAVQEPGVAVVVVPGDDLETRQQLPLTDVREPGVIWYDLVDSQTLSHLPGGMHLSGRGMWGLAWAIRHSYWRLRAPAERIAYGDHPDQWADLRMPVGSLGSQPPAVAVLLHGGFWRSEWGADLMDALAVDLSRRGYASWNVEYRRPDRHGWDVTTGDVADSLLALDSVTSRLDLTRIVVVGHSAGGQLAVQAARRGRVQQVVSLAGVLDLGEGDRRGIGFGAVSAALGGRAREAPEVYQSADPMRLLPLGVPQVIVQGADDDLDLRDFNRRYVSTARAAGDEVRYLEQAGDHFSVIDPDSAIWQATASVLLPV